MTRAPGTKKKTAARTQRLMEEVPLWPAAAIQRGPRTVAMLKRRTSQKPMVLRSWDLGSIAGTGRRVQGTGTAVRVQGSGFRVQGSGFRVQGSGFRVQGSGFSELDMGLSGSVWGVQDQAMGGGERASVSRNGSGEGYFRVKAGEVCIASRTRKADASCCGVNLAGGRFLVRQLPSV